MDTSEQWILFFDQITAQDLPKVGGKNASLGEMIHFLKPKGIQIPEGFATTSKAYWRFLDYNKLREPIQALVQNRATKTLEETGKAIRQLFLQSSFPPEVRSAILMAYRKLSTQYKTTNVDVAVRSSATAEDLPTASFAGQQETYLHIRGEEALLDACLKCYASLFTNRAISYRENQGFEHLSVALSVGIQKMVHVGQKGSGVLFTLDTETGFEDVVILNAGWGLGETVVQGAINPDEYRVYKPLLKKEEEGYQPIISKTCGSKKLKLVYQNADSPLVEQETTAEEQKQFVLSEDLILKLAKWGCLIEEHYQKHMDIEWAGDDETGDYYIIQARPETVQSRVSASQLKSYRLLEKKAPLVSGVSIGNAITSGIVCKVNSPKEIDQVGEGSILVTRMTDPDWVPLMKKVKGIITEQGGRTCHAAIISRELGVPAIVGANQAMTLLNTGQKITLSCAAGVQGYVYEGELPFEVQELSLENLPSTSTALMLNLANPDTAFQWWKLPSDGIGLARMEFIIDQQIRIHPMALVHYPHLKDPVAIQEIAQITERYSDKQEYFVEQLSFGIAQLAASHYPRPVIVRMSDFKSNEYANLIGGKEFEPQEENPMIGFRGASRYYSPRYKAGFALECKALKRVRETMGFLNVILMIPFCRTLGEADQVLQVLEENGLKRGEKGLEVYVMCEIPSNVILAEEFTQRFDGFSIGSNDLTQLILGIDRDSSELASLFDERNEAVKRMICSVIETAHQQHRKVGICGQAPSDHPDFAEFLVDAGIDSISLTPDSFLQVKQRLGQRKKSL
jgi:pyruvate,water dikinase